MENTGSSSSPSVFQKLGTKKIILIILAIIVLVFALYFWLRPKKGVKLPVKSTPPATAALSAEGPSTTDSDLSSIKPGAVNTLYYFWSPSCPHCKTFHSTWKALIEHFLSDPDISFQAINMSNPSPANEQLAFYFNVGPVPTIILSVENGRNSPEFEGNRTLPELVNFITRELDSLADEITETENHATERTPVPYLSD
jgi:thiol-disulfide isomerase/thioredoxin